MFTISDYSIAICFNWILASIGEAFDKFFPQLADRCMKCRTKAPCGYSACRIFLIDLGPQLSRQLLGCILAHCPIYIQHGIHQTIRISLSKIHRHPTNSNVFVLSSFLEYADHHRYSITHAKEKASFPISIAAQDAHNFWLFNCIPFQLNSCL